ncbi:double-strand break repair protein AddB [Tabrizicola oligotrophica]|uniref:Double-strand break repair protein AddB n=1 Tax=Tabrizicola oligotrophica TaxID=2710650 RepID=A0A6M0QUK7_9RHOB|nr:double-strand break repair protein AddB [Tabrizicola oligotrophica]NEY90323.1 double-strand break repair protein AddB [Tabrizicola oligotrophica]
MFDTPGPRLFALPPGSDFPAELVSGLIERMADQPPEAMSRVEVYLNTARMRRRVTDLFLARGARLLPRLRLLTELADRPGLALPPAVSGLRRRLELAQLITALLDAQPDLAPRHALYDLADSLADLMAELRVEGLHPDRLAALDVSNHAAHWARTQAFLGIVSQFFDQTAAPDAEARLAMATDLLAQRWQADPPRHPVLIAGSTGSRGTTLRLMELVARLPQGALILPGFDFDTPEQVWARMDDALTAEDHPQYRFRRLTDRLGLTPASITAWRRTPPPSPARNALVSLALRPAPVTDQWLTDGPALPDLLAATADLTLIEAPSTRTEALAIALMLRQAADSGQTAALVSPDRNLTRQVTAALDRWGILPDDSAGRPLNLSPPGRFLRQIARCLGQKLTADHLLALLKHPLAASGGDRGTHLRLTRDLELSIRRHGPIFPTGADLMRWAETRDDPQAGSWATMLATVIDQFAPTRSAPLADLVARHRSLAETLARGMAPFGSGELWLKEAGQSASETFQSLQDESPHGGQFHPTEYAVLFEAIFAGGEVREAVQAHPRIMIWGTLEARVQGADLVILGGLNDGVWPKAPDPDPWLNRKMRKDAGLLLPERQIGLSAHDFQQAIAAPRVILTRATRDAEAQTVPSRWMNRLENLMAGLPERNGPEALNKMRARGAMWLEMAQAMDRPSPDLLADPRFQPARRPAPQPPRTARPERLSLTEISRLIRDPFAIYARHSLRLRPLDPLRASPDPRDRGSVLHDILERFVRTRPEDETRGAARIRLLGTAAEVLADSTPFPAARLLWLARLERAAEHFLIQDGRHGGTAIMLETPGSLRIDPPGFTLHGKPDRIDALPDGRLHLIDYKTGTPPTARQQEVYEKQLRLTAAMVERGGFENLGPREVASFSYIGLGSGQKVEETDRAKIDLDREWEKFLRLITRYSLRSTGYAARRAVFAERMEGDYDHLARYGEWQMTDRATPARVGEDDPA